MRGFKLQIATKPFKPSVIPAKAGIQQPSLFELLVSRVQLRTLARVLQTPRYINRRLLNHRVGRISRHGYGFIPLIGHLQLRLNGRVVWRDQLANSGALGWGSGGFGGGSFEFDHALLCTWFVGLWVSWRCQMV